MLRAKRVFQNTALRLDKYINFIFNLGLLVQLITPIFSTYFFLSGWDELRRTWGVRLINVFMWTNSTCSLLVLIVFIRQILILSSRDTVNTPTSIDSSNDVENEVNTETKSVPYIDESLLNVISRYLVCVMFATLSTLLVQIMGVIRSEVTWAHVSNLELRMIHFAIRILDESISLTCLSLQFPFGKMMYLKCCKRIDNRISKCFIRGLKLQVASSSYPAPVDTK